MELKKVDMYEPYFTVGKTEKVTATDLSNEDATVENLFYAKWHPRTCKNSYEGSNPIVDNLYEESHTLQKKSEDSTSISAAPVYETVHKRCKNEELPDPPRQYAYVETIPNSDNCVSVIKNTKQPERMSKEITIHKISLIFSVIAVVLFLALLSMVIVIFVKVNSLEQVQMQNLKNESQEVGDSNGDILLRIESLANITFQQNLANLTLHQSLANLTLHQNLANLRFEQSIEYLRLQQSHQLLKIESLANLSRQLSDNYSDIQQQLSSFHNFPSSCADVLLTFPNAPSGYYTIRSNQSSLLISVYCDMTRMCGGVRGGWMRIAQLDTQNCPQGLVNMAFNGTNTCIRDTQEAGCTSLAYISFGIPFSRVCGRIRAYDFGTLDGFHGRDFTNVTANYLDGVSLFYQNTHIWSFVGGYSSIHCTNKPNFVGTDYTYDGPGCNERQFCGKVLWDENWCGQYTPWIYRQLAGYTNADVVANVCRDSVRHNEDIAVASIELYVH